MRLFGQAKPKRTIVRDYGRDAFLVAFNFLLAPLMASRGLRVGLLSEADLLDRMEKDSLRMAEKGYAVVSADRHVLPWLARLGWGEQASFYRVTYELTNPSLLT